ncbi:hypothetical protein RDABS01_033291 [Bienertia sinuspersici]
MGGGSSLLGRVMKAKYYHNSSFLESALGPLSSFSWRSIWSSKALVKEAYDKGRFITSHPVEGINKVSDLINFEKMEWELDLVEGCILAIPISVRVISDELTWASSKEGEYSVKTAYMLGKGCNLDNFHQAWADIWSLEAIPKVRHFLWRMCTGSLPVRSLLQARHLTTQAECPWCEKEQETLNHALFGCERVKELWEDCRVQSLLHQDVTSNVCDLIAHWNRCDRNQNKLEAYLAWNIWMERNKKVFENKATPNKVIVERVKRQVEEFSKYNDSIYARPNSSKPKSLKRWLAPPRGVIKINADAAISNDGWVGVGAVARNHDGDVICAATRRTRASWQPQIAEAKALVLAAKLGRRFGFEKVILETDCQELPNRLAKGDAHCSEVDAILGDVLYLCNEFNSVSWSHVGRDGNSFAHHLARIIPFGDEQIWSYHVPNEVEVYVATDKSLTEKVMKYMSFVYFSKV